MKKLTLMLILLLFGLVSQLQAEEPTPTAGISVTVALEEVISVSVETTSWAIGTVAVDSVTPSGAYKVTNDGNVAENISIVCGNSASWIVVATISTTNQFKMEAKGGDLATYTPIDTPKVLKSNLAALGTVEDLMLNFTAPKAGSVITPQTIPVTLTATKYVVP